MAHVGNGLVNLTSLSLSACGITDVGVARISRDLGKVLEVLNIGQCAKVTDEGLAAIAKNMRVLESVDLYGCTNVTAKGLKSLEKMKTLKTINRGLWHQF
jgi:F-box/leucine-rich repeat protein 14